MIYQLLWKKHIKVRSKILNSPLQRNVVPALVVDQNQDIMLDPAQCVVEEGK